MATQNALLLGMVFAHQATCPKRGQEFRDRVRCEALANLGYNVFTMDDKHDDSKIEEHVRANFADTRRMLNAMRKKWQNTDDNDSTNSTNSGAFMKFQHIILDYFFSPIGWARTRWNPKFFSETLPALVEQGILDDKNNGTLWLPNLSCIKENLDEFQQVISKYYTVEKLSLNECAKHPLYHATDFVEEELLSCPDALTNETQIRPLLDNTNNYPFLRLVVNKHWRDSAPSTPKGSILSKTTKSRNSKRTREVAKNSDDETAETDLETPASSTPQKKRRVAKSKLVAN